MKLPEFINKLDFIISKPVSIDHTLYFMHIGPKGIVSCNTSTGVWTQQLIQSPLHSSYLDLAESDGRIMLAGMLRENDATFICIANIHLDATFISTMKHRRDKSMRKSSRVSYMSEVMEPQIWENFPEDLLEHVLARLPIVTIIRFRTVCKQWNTLITSQSFSQHCAQVSQENPWFYIAFGDDKAMYEPFAKRWYNYNPIPNTFEILALPVSSAGGLVCFSELDHRNLFVCNPLTKSFKKLPAGSIKRWDLSGIIMNGIGGYKVLRLSHNNKEYEIYDSVTENWSHQEKNKIPECIKKPDYIRSNSVSIDNTLYFKHSSWIVSYNTSTGVWTQHLIQVPLHSSSLRMV